MGAWNDRSVSDSTSSARAAAADATRIGDSQDVGEATRPKGRGAGGGDPLVSELRRGGLLPLLVLHEVSASPTYGNQLIDRVAELTGGVVAANPNTMYPLLRDLEAKGFLEGSWEHPERRSRRFYAITDAGRDERDRIASELGPRLDAMAGAIERIRAEVLGD